MATFEEADTRPRTLLVFGAVTCLFWLSGAVYPRLLPPLSPMPDLSGFPAHLAREHPSIREKVLALKWSDAEIVAAVRTALLVETVARWAIIAVGLVSGILIARRRRGGRWLAIVLSAGGLLAEIAIATPGRGWGRLARVDVAFYVLTLVFLTRRRTRVAFAARANREPASPAP